jgi:hypothetical protein
LEALWRFVTIASPRGSPRQRCQPPNGGIVRPDTDVGMNQQKVDDCLYSGLSAGGALRRLRGDVVEDRIEVGKRGAV